MRPISRRFGIEFEFGWPQFNDCTYTFRTQSVIDRLRRQLGNPAWLDAWSCGIDCGGIELRTPPSTNRNWTEIAAVLDAVKALGGYEGRAWGTHVHLDLNDHSLAARWRLLRYWLLVQPAVMALVPRFRRESGWCDTIGFQYTHMSWNEMRQLSVEELPFKRAISFSDFDTVENRLPPCTLDVHRIRAWVDLMRALVAEARHRSGEQVFRERGNAAARLRHAVTANLSPRRASHVLSTLCAA